MNTASMLEQRNFNFKWLRPMASVALLFVSIAAFADDKGKKTSIDFEDQLVEGNRQKPELFYLLQKKDASLKRLIKLREDFLPEMRKTGEDIQLKPSGSP